jgi:hypothetical protein
MVQVACGRREVARPWLARGNRCCVYNSSVLCLATGVGGATRMWRGVKVFVCSVGGRDTSHPISTSTRRTALTGRLLIFSGGVCACSGGGGGPWFTLPTAESSATKVLTATTLRLVQEVPPRPRSHESLMLVVVVVQATMVGREGRGGCALPSSARPTRTVRWKRTTSSSARWVWLHQVASL